MNDSQSEFMKKIIRDYQKISNPGNDSSINMTRLLLMRSWQNQSAAQIFYDVSTLIILILGICGNSICIYHLIYKKILRQSSAQYFGVFCLFDILVLLLYVFPEWLTRGIYPLTGIEILRLHSNPGLCQLYLLLTYWLRLVSIWTLAAYSVDRYMGLRNPRCRRLICGSYYNVKVIVSVTTISLFISVWKPYLSQSTKSGAQNQHICAGDTSFQFSNYIYDTIYACLLTIIPSILIISMNILIAVQLMSWQSNKTAPHVSRKEMIGFQFSALLVLISSSFLFLSWPFFIVWLHSSWLNYRVKINITEYISEVTQTNAPKLITRVLFYLHFGINIFLYTFASKYFKSQIKHVFTLRKMREDATKYYNKK